MFVKEEWSGLSEPDKTVLTSVYGAQVGNGNGISRWSIKYVYRLDENEAIASEKLTQTIYKVKGTLMPNLFNRAVAIATMSEDVFRTGYCRVDGNKTLAVVIENTPNSSAVLFRNLESLDDDELNETISKIAEAELRQDIDLRYAPLIRFAVVHTAADEYAVIVTLPSIAEPFFDFKSFIALALGRATKMPKSSQASSELTRIHSENKAVTDYWTRLLSKLNDAPRLPGAKYKTPLTLKSAHADNGRINFVAHIPPDILSELKVRAKSNRLMMAAILETAWALMLQNFNDSNDVAFFVVPTMKNGNQDATGESVIPVRITNPDDVIVRDVIDATFKQVVISSPYAYYDRFLFDKILAKQGKHFDHFLNFFRLEGEGKRYSEIIPDQLGAVVSVNYRDLRSINRLSVYFHNEGTKVTISFFGEKNTFSPGDLEFLANGYLTTVRQTLIDWDAPLDFFVERLKDRQRTALQAFSVYDSKEILDFASKLALLHECDKGFLQEFVKNTAIDRYFEGDRIPANEKLLFVVKGRVARSVDVGDGWYNVLDIIKENEWLNDTIFMMDDDNALAQSFEVLTESAIVLSVSFAATKVLINNNPLFALNIIKNISRQAEKFRRLWLQS